MLKDPPFLLPSLPFFYPTSLPTSAANSIKTFTPSLCPFLTLIPPFIHLFYSSHICLSCHLHLLFTSLTDPFSSKLFNSLGWSSWSVFLSIKNPCRGTKTDSFQNIKKRNNCSGWFIIGCFISRIYALSLVPSSPFSTSRLFFSYLLLPLTFFLLLLSSLLYISYGPSLSTHFWSNSCVKLWSLVGADRTGAHSVQSRETHR